MRRWVPVLLATAVILSWVSSANAQNLTSVLYHLERFESGTWVEYFPGDPFPGDGGTPGTNTWRYRYEVCNLGYDTGLRELNVFFNSDNVDLAQFAAATQPADWTATQVGPFAPNNNWRTRFRTFVTAARVARDECSDEFSVEFTWSGTDLPGIQNYDAISTSGSDAGQTVPASPVPVETLTWGQIKSRY